LLAGLSGQLRDIGGLLLEEGCDVRTIAQKLGVSVDHVYGAIGGWWGNYWGKIKGNGKVNQSAKVAGRLHAMAWGWAWGGGTDWLTGGVSRRPLRHRRRRLGVGVARKPKNMPA
jgi:hypothetical protein